MERIEMSQQERDWLEWLKRARDGVVTQKRAAEKMDVTERWVRRLLARMEGEGDGVVVHGLRGVPSNRRIATRIQEKALKILRQPEWHDFGPTFASEQLAKRHQIQVSKETGESLDLPGGECFLPPPVVCLVRAVPGQSTGRRCSNRAGQNVGGCADDAARFDRGWRLGLVEERCRKHGWSCKP